MKFKKVMPYAIMSLFLAASPLSAETKKDAAKKSYDVSPSTPSVYSLVPSTYNVAKSSPAVKVEKKTAKTSKRDRTKKEFYLFGANTSLNPVEYNKEIEKVSVGQGFGNAMTFGAGYARKLTDRIKLCLEIGKNEQKVDAKKRVIATGEEIVYGYNYLSLTNVDLALRYGLPLTKTTDLEVALGPALTQAYLESKNETDKIDSVTSVYGAKASLSLCQKLANYFVRAEVSQRTGASGKLDISGLEGKICVGVRK